MGLRLVDYVTYLAIGVTLTAWVGRALHRHGGPCLADALGSAELAESVNRLLVVGFHLVGLGGVALLLQVDGALATPADVVRAVAIRLGLVLLLLGALHLVNMLALHRLGRRRSPAADRRPAEAAHVATAGRWPY
jgi:hypothetical protein